MEEFLKMINNGDHIVGVSIEVGELVKVGFALDLYPDNVKFDNGKLRICDLSNNALELNLEDCDIKKEGNSDMFLITNKENNMIVEMSFIF